LIIALPAMVALIVIAGPLIISLFCYSQFTPHDVWMTRQSVLAYSFGLPAFMLVKVLSAAFYAKQDTKTPVKIGVISIVANMVLNAALVFPFAHAGLALAASLGSWINAFLLFWYLRRRNIFHLEKHWWWFGLQMLIANLVLALILWLLAGSPQEWIHHHFGWRALKVIELGTLGGIAYFFTLWLMGMRWHHYRIAHD
jgi:putative peptidoglycan lipid II flippase